MAEMWINMGPQHPMTHGLWNLRVKVDGETIVDAEPVVGYLHRGWEKLVENRMYPQIIPLSDRLCYGASMSWSHLYCLTIEELMGVEVPERAEYIRVIVLELQRIASHLMWLAAYGTDLGLLTGFVYAMRERELFLDLLQSVSGARMTYNYMRIGGVRNDLPPNFERDCLRTLDYFEKKLDEYEQIYDGSDIFLMRTQDIGYLKPADAINLGVTGPTLRGSGVKIDIREHDPYSVYDELDWDICTHPDCDCYARYRVRMDEMRMSCHIIREAFKKMPDGPVRVKVPRNAPKRTAFARVEDPRGEGLMYVIGDGTDRPFRLKVRSPIFVTVSAVPIMLKGYKVADVPAIMGSVDMCLGETDR
ncbi:MAG: NADH-quinone oxidoreductase subunit D [Methanomassiliicoccales archaeon]|jgi:NADH-quinone oxidoreductase subunit D|nr:NADH-quinone oxidoreductase subunit D [Methanomassiliicoccales archaeon]